MGTLELGANTFARTMLPSAGSVKSSQLCGDANYSRARSEERPITRTTTLRKLRNFAFHSLLSVISAKKLNLNRDKFLIGKFLLTVHAFTFL